MRGGRSILVVSIAVAGLALGGCETLRRKKPADPVAAPVVTPAPPPEPLPPTPPPPLPSPPKSCVPRNLPAPPRYPDTDSALRAAGGAADRYQLMAAGRLLRQKRLDELERVVAGCR
ncbi:MAG: hypothetical protein ACOY5Y_17200 [Pseudomonadota bacterium]